MTTATFTTAGITSPSSTTRAYKGVTSAKPPSSGGDMTTPTEFTTTEYTNASTDNGTAVSQANVLTSDYAAFDFQFFIPPEQRNLLEIVFGIEGRASDGYVNTYGWTLYLRDNKASAWTSMATVSGSFSYQLQQGRQNSSPRDYLDSNGRVRIMLISNAQDTNGNGPEADIDYAFLTISYGPASLYGYPGEMPGAESTGYLYMGAVVPSNGSALGYPGAFPGGETTGYDNIGALQKQIVVASGATWPGYIGGGFF